MSEMICVHRPLHEAERDLLCEVFEAEGIAYRYVPSGTWNEHVAGALARAHGIGEMRVPPELEEKARKLVAEALPGSFSEDIEYR